MYIEILFETENLSNSTEWSSLMTNHRAVVTRISYKLGISYGKGRKHFSIKQIRCLGNRFKYRLTPMYYSNMLKPDCFISFITSDVMGDNNSCYRIIFRCYFRPLTMTFLCKLYPLHFSLFIGISGWKGVNRLPFRYKNR